MFSGVDHETAGVGVQTIRKRIFWQVNFDNFACMQIQFSTLDADAP